MFLSFVSWWIPKYFIMGSDKILKEGVVNKFLNLVFCCFVGVSKDVWEVVCPAYVIKICVWWWSKN